MDGNLDPMTGYARGPDGRLKFQRIGSGPTVVLLHPLALSGAIYRPLAARLAGQFDTIAIDLRGHGGSTWSRRQFAISDLGEDVLAVLDALDRKSVSLIGMSMGGCAAMAIASAHPDRVDRLVLADTTAWYGPEAAETWSKRAISAATQPRPDQLPFQLQRWFTDDYAAHYGVDAQTVASVFVATDGGVHAAACRALGAMDLRAELPSITAATLVLTGTEDYATPPVMGRAVASLIPGAQFEELTGMRHLSLVEAPQLADRIAGHLMAAVA